MGNPLAEGKVDPRLLKELLGELPQEDDRVTIGAHQGDDAAAIRMGEHHLIVGSDPITFPTDRAAWYALHVNANDVATMGAEPKWFMTTVMLPAGSASEEMLRSLFGELARVCREVGVTLCGGHTEVTSAVTRPVIVGQMMGEVESSELVDSRRLEPGDRILLTGGLAIEGTSILVTELADRLKDKVDPILLQNASRFLDRPGISVLPAARIARQAARLKAMHDPTEGGLATACHELARLAGVGIDLVYESILIHPETRAICEVLDLDPLGTLASGALLIGVAPDRVGTVLAALDSHGIPSCIIGETTSEAGRVRILHRAVQSDLPEFPSDEILRALP